MKKWFAFLMVVTLLFVTLLLMAGCGSPAQEEAAPEQPVEEAAVEEIAWDMIPVEEQSLEVTFTDEAKAQMDQDWEARSDKRFVFSMIPGSS